MITGQEASQKEVTLEDRAEYVPAIDAMISFMYYADYQDQWRIGPELHVRVFLIADKYEVRDLEKVAVTKFLVAATSAQLMVAWPSTVHLVYKNTLPSHRAIRDAVIKTSLQNKATLTKLLLDKTYVEMLDETGEFGRELLQELHGVEQSPRARQAPSEAMPGAWTCVTCRKPLVGDNACFGHSAKSAGE